jgi:hypothetical protein
VSGVTGVDGDISSYTSPAYQLTIRDPGNNAVLWTITSPVVLAGRKRELARWVTQSEENLISRIKVVAGETLTTMPKFHTGRFEKTLDCWSVIGCPSSAMLLVFGIPVVAAVAGGSSCTMSMRTA